MYNVEKLFSGSPIDGMVLLKDEKHYRINDISMLVNCNLKVGGSCSLCKQRLPSELSVDCGIDMFHGFKPFHVLIDSRRAKINSKHKIY